MKRGFLNFGTLAILGLICLAVAATLAFNTYLVKKTPPAPQSSATPSPLPSPTPPTLDENDELVCVQVITPAINPRTGERKEFPTPCDVPEGWQKVQ